MLEMSHLKIFESKLPNYCNYLLKPSYQKYIPSNLNNIWKIFPCSLSNLNSNSKTFLCPHHILLWKTFPCHKMFEFENFSMLPINLIIILLLQNHHFTKCFGHDMIISDCVIPSPQLSILNSATKTKQQHVSNQLQCFTNTTIIATFWKDWFLIFSFVPLT